MRADLQLDPDGLRRVAHAARRIADRLAAADPGPSAAGADLELRQERLRESVRRARDELSALAACAASAAARVEDADRVAAGALRAIDARGDR